MASTLKLTFVVEPLDPAPYVRGEVQIKFNDGTSNHSLDEILDLGNLGTGYFKEETYSPGNETLVNGIQASNYALAFNRDHKNVGGTKNIFASVVGNEVTLTAKKGTFSTGSSYTGNVLTIGFLAPNNQTTVDDLVLSSSPTSNGTCSVIEYDVAATGGTGPYTLRNGSTILLSNWDGLSTTLAFARGEQHNLILTDSDSLSDTLTINVPRTLIASEFKQRVVPFIGGSDLTIDSVNPVTGTTPIEYSLDGTNYQTSNIFPGILEDTYTLYIRDKFGCEVTKTIVVYGLGDATEEERIRKFIVSDYNSLSFSKDTVFNNYNRKNYSNTLSYEEAVKLPKKATFYFTSDDDIETQFKSSYPFHVVTLFKCDGTKENLPFIKIQENLGVTEKVDCKLFPITDGIGVYFDGGNSYTPNTTTIIDNSPYTTGLPSWAEIGQYVAFGTLGTKEIKSIGYDKDLQKMYFVVDGTITVAANDTAQVTYNRHDTDVYRCDFNMSKVSDKAFVRIEMGWSFDEIEDSYSSEPIKLLKDTTNYLKHEWSGYKNIGDMIFVDGIKGIMWVKGRIRPYPISEAQTYDGTDQTYSLEQVARMGQKATIPTMTPKQWNKFNLVSGITQGGNLYIEGMELVRTGSIEFEELDQSNYSNVSCEFAYAGESLYINNDEIVLNPSTGVVGSGGTGKDPVLGWDGFRRIQLNDGTYLRLESGTFIALN